MMHTLNVSTVKKRGRRGKKGARTYIYVRKEMLDRRRTIFNSPTPPAEWSLVTRVTRLTAESLETRPSLNLSFR